jgi:hypothetical protein
MVTRRGFLKVAPLGLKTAPQQAAETIVKPIKNTVKAARNYDGVLDVTFLIELKLMVVFY